MSEKILIREIIKRSVAEVWAEAVTEWAISRIYIVAEPQECLCSHYPIKEICELQNKINRTIVVVGNCCVTKFMGLPSDKLFQAFKKIKKDVWRSINEELLQYAFTKKWINDREYKFYLDIRLKRKQNYKQLQNKLRINLKILKHI